MALLRWTLLALLGLGVLAPSGLDLHLCFCAQTSEAQGPATQSNADSCCAQDDEAAHEAPAAPTSCEGDPACCCVTVHAPGELRCDAAHPLPRTAAAERVGALIERFVALPLGGRPPPRECSRALSPPWDRAHLPLRI